MKQIETISGTQKQKEGSSQDDEPPSLTCQEDWQWQVRNSICTIEELKKIITLTDEEKKSISTFPFRVTPYYLDLIKKTDSPLRKSMIPTILESVISSGESTDPLHEDEHSPVQNIIHKYPDRCLFLITNFCSSFCRFCTRSRRVGNPTIINKKEWDVCIEYIKNTPAIRDVIVSGGDPLTLSDENIEYLLKRLKEIEHVEIIRIGTKIPIVLPQRITPELINILKKYHPLFISIHATHPDELTLESQKACNMLADAGIVLGSQTVLLKGINDNVKIMKKLFHELLKVRVRPLYIFSMDRIPGSEHFFVPVQKGLEIIDNLRGHTSSYAIPSYVIDTPSGKVTINPQTIQSIDNNAVVIKSYDGQFHKFENPQNSH